jgi:DNA repair photolyase
MMQDAMIVRLIQCKSALAESALADWCINCYVGCEHGCRYCYARYMKRFTAHNEPWGDFVDVRVNAPEVLAREVRRKKRGRVFLSSVCDGWQPLEREFQVTRGCLRILVESGWPVCVLTKSALVRRDLDLLEKASDSDLGVTVTAADEKVREKIEPCASATAERLDALAEAGKRGIEVWAFLGPFIPGLTDTQENIEWLIARVAPLPITHFYVDRLNFRSGVASSVRATLKRYFPAALGQFDAVASDPDADAAYQQALGKRARALADKHGVADKIRCGL